MSEKHKANQDEIHQNEIDSLDFMLLAEQSPNMIWLNIDGKVIYANKRCHEVLGYTVDELCAPGFDFMTLIAPECRDLIQRTYSEHLRGDFGLTFELDYELLTKDDSRIPCHLNTKLINHKDQPAILGIVTDISDIKGAQAELQRNREQVRSIIEHSPMSIVIAGNDGSVRYVNDAACKLWNIDSPDIAIGCSFAGYIHADSRQHSQIRFSQALAGQLVVPEIIKAQQHDGTMFYLESVILSVEWDNEPAIMAIAREVTEELQVEGRVREAKTKALQTISHGIAHEFRNLLAGVGSCAYSVRHQTRDKNSQELLDSVIAEVKRGQSIIKDLLLYSQNEDIALEAVELGGFLRSYLHNWAENELNEQDISTMRDICRRHVLIEANTRYLELVISNVIRNSIEAMAGVKDKVLNLKLSIEGDVAVIRVEDNGRGMDKDQLKVAMDPFYTTKTEHQGHGLGLSISLNLVNSMSGTMDIESTPGRGSIVRISFPLIKQGS